VSSLRVCGVLILLSFFSCSHPLEKTMARLVSQSRGIETYEVKFLSPAINELLWYRAIVPKGSQTEQVPVLVLLHGATSSPAE
jgi:poly(3-hydroxybutyrate) depolymerase